MQYGEDRVMWPQHGGSGLWAYVRALPLVAQCLDHGLSMLCFGSKDLSCHLYPCSLEHKRKTKNQTKPQTYNQTKPQTQLKTQTQPKN